MAAPDQPPKKRFRGRKQPAKAPSPSVVREVVGWVILYPDGTERSWDEARRVSCSFRLLDFTALDGSVALPSPLAMMQAAITGHHTDAVARDAATLLPRLCARHSPRW